MAKSSSLPPSLRSAETKLKRANLHKSTAYREARRFFNRHAAPSFRIEPIGDESDIVGAVNRCRLVFDGDPPELPASFAARFGDAIYNYRCVLDHIAWQLVCHGASWPLPKRAQRSVQFPIYETANGFTSKQGLRLPGVDKRVIRFIKSRHKYVGGNATNDALIGLAGICNDDKHRELRFFGTVFRALNATVTFTNCEPISWDNAPQRPRFQNGAVVTLFSYRVTKPNPKMRMELAPQIQIVDELWRDFSEMLEAIRAEVTEILHAPEIHAAVS